MFWLIVGIIAAILLLLVVVSFIGVRFSYKRSGDDDRFYLTVSWLGIRLYALDISFLDLLSRGPKPAIRVKSDSNTPATVSDRGLREIPLPEALARWWPWFVRLKGPAFYILTRLNVEELNWFTRLGTGQAAQTGILSGFAWTAKSVFFKFAAGVVRFDRQPRFAVYPDFVQPAFATNVDCILRVRVGHIMIAALKALRLRR